MFMLYIWALLQQPTFSLVISYNGIEKVYYHMTGGFGPQTYNVSGPFIVAQPATYCPGDTDGKQVNVSGKIVLIERSGCNFVEKAYLAQINYAVGVVIGDNIPEDSFIKMGPSGENASKVDIPSVSIQYYDYVDLAKLGTLNVLNATLDGRGEVFYSVTNPWADLAWWTLPILGLCVIISALYAIRRWCCERCQRQQRFNIASRMPLINYRSDGEEGENKSTSGSTPAGATPGEPYQAMGQKQVHNESCAICLDDFVEGSRIKVLPCKHGFHASCIDPWLNERSDLCPICKTSILQANPQHLHPPSACVTFCCPCRQV